MNFTDPSGLFWGFFKKLFKWALVALAVVVAVMTIVTFVTNPFTMVALLSVISAVSSGAAADFGAFGMNSVAKIFGIVAIVAGIGAAGLSALKNMRRGSGNGFGSLLRLMGECGSDENPCEEPGVIRIETWARHWNWLDRALQALRFVKNVALALPRLAFNKNVQKCFNGWRFSKLAGAIGGQNAQSVAEVVEVGGEVIVVGDGIATAYKWTKMNPLKRGSSPLASSVNFGIRKLGRKIGSKSLLQLGRGVGKRVLGPVALGAGVFTGSYNYGIAVACSSEIIR